MTWKQVGALAQNYTRLDAKGNSTVILRDQFLKFGLIWLEDKNQLTNKQKKKKTNKENSEQTSHQEVSLSKASTSSSLSAGRISS